MRFRNEFYFMSNMFPVEIKIGEYTFSCAESAFQASKCLKPEDKKRFESLNGFEAKKLGRKVDLRPDWNDVRIPLMKRILKIKFSHPDLAEKLMAVKGDIIEENTWHDTFWGVCEGRGENHLGLILMELRDKLLASPPKPSFTLTEVKGDLLADYSQDNVYAHCVSADFALGAGVAKQFRDKLNMKQKLFRACPDSLDLWDSGCFGYSVKVGNVCNLVTKRNCYNKPTYKTLEKALIEMKCQLINDSRPIHIPAIGCGLDRLDWAKVRGLIEVIFRDTNKQIFVHFL